MSLTPDHVAKKLAAYCRLEGIEPTLPCYISVKKYDRKVVKFKKPLFPNYLFLRLLPDQRKTVYQSDYVANLLEVFDQKTFEEQLQDILRTLDLDIEVQAEPQITEGRIVQIKSDLCEEWKESSNQELAKFA